MSPLGIIGNCSRDSERLPVSVLTHLVSFIAIGFQCLYCDQLMNISPCNVWKNFKCFPQLPSDLWNCQWREQPLSEFIKFNHIGSVIIWDVKWIECCTRKTGKDLFWLVFLYIIHKYNFLVWHCLIFDRSHGSEPSVVVVWRPLFVWWTHPERPYIRSRLTIWFLQYYVWSGSDGSWLMKTSLHLVDTPWETVVHHYFFFLLGRLNNRIQ